MSDPLTRDIGRAIANCATRLALEIPMEGDQLGEGRLTGAMLCNRRLCPFCEWRRTRAWRARLIPGLNAFADEHPNWSGVFLTLTVRNCEMHELRDTIDHMHRSLNRLVQTTLWPTDLWMRRTEITVQDRGVSCPTEPHIRKVHPHIHCLLLVRPSYWSRDYIKQSQWQAAWQTAARLDYAPVVDVRRAKPAKGAAATDSVAPVPAVLEAAKYMAKATDLAALGDMLPQLNNEMRGLRLIAISKALSRYVGSADMGPTNMFDLQKIEVPPITPTFSAIAEWLESAQEYRFAP
jgi:plasmid rolling circle replication initiator protein Rep